MYTGIHKIYILQALLFTCVLTSFAWAADEQDQPSDTTAIIAEEVQKPYASFPTELNIGVGFALPWAAYYDVNFKPNFSLGVTASYPISAPSQIRNEVVYWQAEAGFIYTSATCVALIRRGVITQEHHLKLPLGVGSIGHVVSGSFLGTKAAKSILGYEFDIILSSKYYQTGHYNSLHPSMKGDKDLSEYLPNFPRFSGSFFFLSHLEFSYGIFFEMKFSFPIIDRIRIDNSNEESDQLNRLAVSRMRVLTTNFLELGIGLNIASLLSPTKKWETSPDIPAPVENVEDVKNVEDVENIEVQKPHASFPIALNIGVGIGFPLAVANKNIDWKVNPSLGVIANYSAFAPFQLFNDTCHWQVEAGFIYTPVTCLVLRLSEGITMQEHHLRLPLGVGFSRFFSENIGTKTLKLILGYEYDIILSSKYQQTGNYGFLHPSMKGDKDLIKFIPDFPLLSGNVFVLEQFGFSYGIFFEVKLSLPIVDVLRVINSQEDPRQLNRLFVSSMRVVTTNFLEIGMGLNIASLLPPSKKLETSPDIPEHLESVEIFDNNT